MMCSSARVGSDWSFCCSRSFKEWASSSTEGPSHDWLSSSSDLSGGGLLLNRKASFLGSPGGGASVWSCGFESRSVGEVVWEFMALLFSDRDLLYFSVFGLLPAERERLRCIVGLSMGSYVGSLVGVWVGRSACRC